MQIFFALFICVPSLYSRVVLTEDSMKNRGEPLQIFFAFFICDKVVIQKMFFFKKKLVDICISLGGTPQKVGEKISYNQNNVSLGGIPQGRSTRSTDLFVTQKQRLTGGYPPKVGRPGRSTRSTDLVGRPWGVPPRTPPPQPNAWSQTLPCL